MKKNYFLLLLLFFSSQLLLSQTTTETFENELNNSTTFSEGGITFNITSQQSFFRIQGNYRNTGWNGTARDDKYIDNSNYTSSTRGVEFTVTAANGAAINLKSMWLYISTSGLNLSPIGTVTITGKLGNATVFTGSRSDPFNPDANVDNGFTFVDFTNFGGQDNSNKVIDSYVITTDNGIGYISLDAVKFECAPVTFTGTSHTNVTCNGGNNGTATVTTANGGTLTYNWSPGNPTGDGTPTVSGLTAGEWICTVTNACGKSNITTFTITQPNAITAATTQTNVLCNGDATGNAGVTPSGGTGGYSYLWSNGSTASSITGVPAGNYSVTIRDAANCSITQNFVITQPEVLVATTSQINVLCAGSATGIATVNPTGGTGFYVYSWLPTGGTGGTATGLTAGTYTVTVTDANNCSVTKTVTITEPLNALAATTTQSNVLCNGGSTGIATVYASGGTGNYTYLWSNGVGGSTISYLPAGNYSVAITDNNNCSITKYFTITQPDALTATSTQFNVLCNGGSTGSASVVASGGSGGYSYSWSNGETSATVTGLAIGNYSVVITDGNNCALTKNFTVTQPDVLTATTSIEPFSCTGNTTTATVMPLGGAGAYTYTWVSAGSQTVVSTNSTATNLAEGSYTITITDANNCTLDVSLTVVRPDDIEVAAVQTNALCNGGTGSIALTPVDVNASYTYLWSTGQTTSSITGISSGNYSATITNTVNGCSVVQYFTLTQPDSLTATQFQFGINCNNGVATASVTASGGAGGYTYQWLPSGGNDYIAFNLTEGDYSVLITDANGCTITKYFSITNPTPITAATSVIEATCLNGYTATATVTATGGTGIYTYSWYPYGGNAATSENLYGGEFTVTITDSNRCSITKDIFIEYPVYTNIFITQTAATCTEPGSATVTVDGGSGQYTYVWSNGSTEATATGLTSGYYVVTVTDVVTTCSDTREVYVRGPGSCTEATAWNGSAWSNGPPTCVSYAVAINGDYNSALHGSITACSLTVNTGNVVVTAGYTFAIQGSVIVADGSTLTFEDNAALLQSDSYNENSGNIIMRKNSNALYRLDYTLWSSPLNGSQTLGEFSPETAATRFYEYIARNDGNGYRDLYAIVDPSTTFETAKGYLIRMPNNINNSQYNAGSLAVSYPGEFVGMPNNGYIEKQASVNGGRYTAVGNPYPSPLSLVKFFDRNRHVIDTQSGIYFWRKRNNASATSYATLTLAAYTANNASDGGAEQAAYFTGDNTNWLISQGQGFIVRTDDLAEYTKIVFSNDMRRPAPVSGNQAFLRQSQSSVSRLWLNLTAAGGTFSQAAIAYISTATTGIDYGYDGQVFNDGGSALYSTAMGVDLAIQARPAFNVNDIVPIGFTTATAGEYTIALDHFEGVFSQSQDIYLKDNVTGQTHDLKESNYTFATEPGTFNSRFEVVYNNDALGVDPVEISAGSIMVYKEGNVITINSSANEIKGITVYDMRGRKLYSKEGIKATQTEVSGLQAANQVLIVQIDTLKGSVSKKIVF